MEKSVFLFSKDVFAAKFVENITYDECQKLTYSDYLTENGYLIKLDCKNCSNENQALSDSGLSDEEIKESFVVAFGFPKAYVVTLEYRLDGDTEYEVNSVYTDKSQAIAKLKELRGKITNVWTALDDGWKKNNDTDTLFQYSRNNWQDYYEVEIHERELK